MALIRSVSGVRGIVGEDLDVASVYRHVRAFAELQPPGAILLARDSRPHGKTLMAAASGALHHARRRSVIAGLVPTPTAQFLVLKRRLAGAVVLTASHNPVEYNGMKFIGGDGTFLGPDAADILYSRADQNETPMTVNTGKTWGQDLPDGAGEHILDILDLGCIDVDTIVRKRFRVAVDTVNGAAAFALPTLLEALGCEVVRLHTTPDGTFPRGTEPLPENLAGLGEVVRQNAATIGLATDPDADRLALVDETGTPLGEELTQVLAVDGFLRRTGSRKPVVTNLSSSMLLDGVAARYGNTVERTAVGEINVVNRMQALGSHIGGEGNGGVILLESHLGRDSLVGAALILDRLAQDDRPVSEIRADLPQTAMIKDKVSIEGLDPKEITAKISAVYSDVEQSALDGLKLIWPDRWIHVRRSNTEPIIRLIAEGPDENTTRSLIEDLKAITLGEAS